MADGQGIGRGKGTAVNRRRDEGIQSEEKRLGPRLGGETFPDSDSERLEIGIEGEAREFPSPFGNDWWSIEPDVGRVAHGVPARVDRLRGLGNAVVPQVAEHIGRLILQGGEAA